MLGYEVLRQILWACLIINLGKQTGIGETGTVNQGAVQTRAGVASDVQASVCSLLQLCCALPASVAMEALRQPCVNAKLVDGSLSVGCVCLYPAQNSLSNHCGVSAMGGHHCHVEVHTSDTTRQV